MNNDNFPILKNSTPSTSEKNINFINEMISNTLFNRKTNGEINLHEFSSKAKSFRSYDKFLDINELDAEKLKEIKAFMNSVDKLEPIRDGLICWLDGRDGNNNDRTTIWKDRSGNGNDATLVGFDFNENSGWGDGYLLNKVGDYGRIDIPKELFSKGITLDLKISKISNDAISRPQDVISNNENGGVSIGIIENSQAWNFQFHDNVTSGYINYRYNCDLRNIISICNVVSNETYKFRDAFVNGTLIHNLPKDQVRLATINNYFLFTNPSGNSITPDTSCFVTPIRLYSVRIYNRALTSEEVRHNYLYDLSVQYLLKNQANPNTIETYYDFDPNYDLPDNRVEGCLMVSNGRLVYYNPSGSAPLRIANNKTLDECIVEETEDYIIYSDGDKTELDPIPEGIYFACRVDKHTGEIYYGEGYENLRDMSSNYEPYNSLKILNEDWVKFTRNNPGGTYSFSSILYTENVVHNVSLVSKGEDGGCLRTLGGNTRTNFNIIKENHKPPLFELVYSAKRTNKQWVEPSINKVVPTGYKLFVNKFQITRTENKKPYIRNKQPRGLLAFISNKTTLNTSFIFKDRKSSRPGSSSSSVLTSTSDGANSDKFGFYMIPPICNTEQTIDIFVSGSYKVSEMTVTNTSNSGGFLNLAYKVHSNPSVGWTESIKAFIFYKGDLTQAELEAEKNKTFKLKKFYRTNTNQSSFLGLEDIFTNNNTKEIIDGTIIDTTKTPIEYKEQQDISKTSDIASYTKNNINIEKSKCGYIRDIRNTNDFKNLPNKLVPEPSKYDERYQSPTVNILSILREWDGGFMGSDEIGDFFYKTGEPWTNGMAMDLNKDIKLNQTYTWIWELMVMDPTVTGKSCTLDVNSNPLIEGSNDKGHVTPDGIPGFTLPETTRQWKRYELRVSTIEHPRDLLQVVLCPNNTELVNKKIYYRNIQILEGDFRNQDIDYTPPNSDGNFIPTIGESGIFSVKQTTKDTDKSPNTFARTIFLP